MTRIPVLEAEQLNPAQKQIHDKIASGPRGRAAHIFRLLLNSPGLADTAQQVGAYLRYNSTLSDRVRELAIVTVAAYWKVDYEWRAHAPLAAKAGVPESTLEEFGRGKRPRFADSTDGIVYDYVTAALKQSGIEEAVYDEARRTFDEEQLVDLTAIAGYYTMLATFMNAFDLQPEPAEPRAPWRTSG